MDSRLRGNDGVVVMVVGVVVEMASWPPASRPVARYFAIVGTCGRIFGRPGGPLSDIPPRTPAF